MDATAEATTVRGGNAARAFFDEAARAGCPSDQVTNYVRAGVVPQPKQLRFAAAARACDRDGGPVEVGFGGAMGGGKSWTMIAQIGVDDCQRVPELKCLLLRRHGKAVREQFEDLKSRCYGRLPHTWNRGAGVLRFANGSRVVLGHFKDERDVDSYLGLEYDVVAVEEATTLSATKLDAIRTRLRTSKAGWRPRLYATWNWGGVGHSALKRRFWEPSREGRETETRFVAATVADNAFVNEGYSRQLERLTGWQRRAWLLGDPDIAAGQYFTTFCREAHEAVGFDERKATEWWAGFDYGFAHPTAFVLVARDGDGSAWVVDEHGERAWLPERHARAIKAMLRRHRTWQGTDDAAGRELEVADLRSVEAGTDAFGRGETGRTVAQAYGELGIGMTPASTDRVGGAAEVLRRLGDPARGVAATLRVHVRCARVLAALASMQHDPARPEDVLKADCSEDGEGGDDFYDALRYALMRRRRELRVVKLRGF